MYQPIEIGACPLLAQLYIGITWSVTAACWHWCLQSLWYHLFPGDSLNSEILGMLWKRRGVYGVVIWYRATLQLLWVDLPRHLKITTKSLVEVSAGFQRLSVMAVDLIPCLVTAGSSVSIMTRRWIRGSSQVFSIWTLHIYKEAALCHVEGVLARPCKW